MPCATTPRELLVLGDLPIDRDRAVRHAAAFQRPRCEAGPQHDAVLARAARGDAEREGIGGEGERLAADDSDRPGDRAGGQGAGEEAAAREPHARCPWNRALFRAELFARAADRPQRSAKRFLSRRSAARRRPRARAERRRWRDPSAGRRQGKAAGRLRRRPGAPTARCARRRRSRRCARSWRRRPRARRGRRPAPAPRLPERLARDEAAPSCGSGPRKWRSAGDCRAACARPQGRA